MSRDVLAGRSLADDAVTIDAFHRGAFHLVQPARKGHRAGMDAMMLAAAVPNGFTGRLADLGAGAGAAGLAVAARCPQARVLLVERSPDMARCARRSLDLAPNGMLRPRVAVLETDVALAGRTRAPELADNSFDYVIMNPPFNLAHDRRSPDAMRQEAHVMEGGLFEKWLRTAAAIVKPRGGLALIARPDSLAEILAAMDRRFGSAQILPIHPRQDEPAIRIVARARRGARGGLTLMPPLMIHDPAGDGFSATADDINNGRASLFGD